MAVVKANAYGHGDIQISKILQNSGITDFAVSNIDEACRLRKAGIKGQILILGYTPITYIQRLFDYDITQALVSEEYAEAVANMNIPIKCQFAIDTGMNRIGLNLKEIDKCEDIIRKYGVKLNITGIFTHLCIADTDTKMAVDFTKEQICKFEKLSTRLSDLNLSYIHCLNSAGGLWHDSYVSYFIRLGIILYGLKPDYKNRLPEGIEPAMEWKSEVSMVKTVLRGDTIGYGRSFIAESNMLVATIPTGYADGYNRLLSNKGYVIINGQKAPIVGKICMDQFMVDITKINDVKMGTEVILMGKYGDESLDADDIAKMTDTIGYEVICNISSRVPRIYV